MCHGAGGLQAQYRFGGRTGLTPIIFGVVLLALALGFADRAAGLFAIIPIGAVGALLIIAGTDLAISRRLFDGKPSCLWGDRCHGSRHGDRKSGARPDTRMDCRVYPNHYRSPIGPRKVKAMKSRLILLVAAASVLALPVLAGALTTPYAGQQTRTIKALSAEDIAALLAGDGMGFAKAAELNGFPGPKHVLDLADRLNLTPDQRRQIGAIFEKMTVAAKPLGAELVDRERALDQLFQKGEITSDRLAQETAAIGNLQGRLRDVHLSAHLETRALLSADQIALYERLRGYADPDMSTMHHHG
jgi:Spy/CpxP family protein refolding chaperone